MFRSVVKLGVPLLLVVVWCQFGRRRKVSAPFDVTRVSYLLGDDLVEGRACQVCGCTDVQACRGGCYWVDSGLCSRCVSGGGYVSGR